MSNPDMDKFNKALEKICTDAGADVAKLLAGCRGSVNSRLDKMAKDIASLPVPPSSAGDLTKIQEQVNSLLKKASSRFSGICTLTAAVRVEGGKKLSVPASGVSGPLATI